MIDQHCLDDCRFQLRTLKAQAEKAMAQIDDRAFFALIDPEANSIALIAKHVAGNMRSRWTDFLTTDGEKPDRNRDGEFEIASGETRETIMAQWERGWAVLFDALAPLRGPDLGRSVTIRGEPHTVLQALNRQIAHYATHVGQIVLLAKHLSGPRWQTLSIPKRKR